IVSVDEERSAAGSLDVQEYFVKPLDRDTFLGRLRELQPGLFEGGRPLTALVVENDPADRKRLRDYLAGEQIAVVEAAAGAEALLAKQALSPEQLLDQLHRLGLAGGCGNHAAGEAVRTTP